MADSSRFSCFLIGGESLLLACAEQVTEAGHDLRGVVSDAEQVRGWARKAGIPVVPVADLQSALAERPFDYLLAITHLSLLPPEVLAMPQRFAVNFHDGPLPRYAGLNAPAWAVLNGEHEYGVTWHVMTAGVDEGDLLVQRTFPMGPAETTLSLNARCFEAGIESFGELLTQLGRETPLTTPQDRERRSYFRKYQRPPAACMLDWRRPASELCALVRGMDFGPRYPNSLGLPKLFHAGRLLGVSRVRVQPEMGGGAEGAVLSVDDEAITIACADGSVLALTGFVTLSGRELSVAEAARRLELGTGTHLDPVPPERLVRLVGLDLELARSEAFWVERLATLEPAELPQARAGVPSTTPVAPSELALEAPASFREWCRERGRPLREAMAAAFLVYLYRIGDKESFDVAVTHDLLREASTGLEAWVARAVPFRARLDGTETFEEVLARTGSEWERVRRRRTWLHDAVARHPQLRERPELAEGLRLPIGVKLIDADRPVELLKGTLLTLACTRDSARFIHDGSRLSHPTMAAMKRDLGAVMDSIARGSTRPIRELDLLGPEDRRRLLLEWNATDLAFRSEACVHHLIEEQVEETPDAVALVFRDEELSYRELDRRANRLAAHLRALGVGPDQLVGLCIERSVDLVVAMLATLKAGAGYLPLDPAYPKERLGFILEDSEAPLLITQDHHLKDLPKTPAELVLLERDRSAISSRSAETVRSSTGPEQLAYAIYTSGSTGKPKGVLVEHRNVVNFFTGMDACVPHDPPGTWLAVTSLSFDISVLELLWTLARGFKVVLHHDVDEGSFAAAEAISSRPMDFGIFLWGNDDGPGAQKYALMLESARFADQHGFSSIWSPERHFHAFGGPYPNPSVTSAAIAAVTSRIGIRAGSCVLPLHHPLRVAEEWAVVDNLSDGRVALAIASGWQPNDFVLRPENYPDNKAAMVRDIDVLRRLWRGEAMSFPGLLGEDVELSSLPRPVQPELPIWITSAGNPETYRLAGELGANVLTHLLGQSVEEVAEKIRIYREAREAAGHDPATGKVTLMLHTFVSWEQSDVRERVRQPMKDYLASSVSLVKNYAWAFPAFKRPDGLDPTPADVDLSTLSEEENEAVLDFAFERYFDTSGLFGTPETCLPMIERLKAIEVDEIGCLIDFGIPSAEVLKSLEPLAELLRRSNFSRAGTLKPERHSIAAELREHSVTHMQCTPSLARMLSSDDEGRQALRRIEHLFVGGEALPAELARDLRSLRTGTLRNMYGPTETTVWSSTWPLDGDLETIPIGRPIANTQIYVLGRHDQPVPAGVPGELCIGGAGVTRGYLRRPELTADRFVPDPFSGADGARLYRTGDLARWRDDGVLEFLGRRDHQVKIRGHRIELGEIEAVLMTHSTVKDCVLLARTDRPGDERLVAYYVPVGPVPTPFELRSHLQEKLPDYMIPSSFVPLATLPLTQNGKIDRKALPAPDEGMSPRASSFVAPESGLEATLAELWQETLGLGQVGIEDNFFDLGGHSLLVVQLHRNLREKIQQPVSLTDLYRFPTIRSLTEHLAGGRGSDALDQAAERAERRRQSQQRRRRGRTG